MVSNKPLTDIQIIRLHHELLAPVAVHEIIKGHDELDETARYTLDVMIAEFKPDTALICIALCAAHIAEMHSGYLPIAGSLGFEAGRIVHEFGPTWLANADRRLTAAHERHVMDLLDQMPEDFEAMADLLDATRAHLIETTDSAILCEILSQNARAFIDYLEEQAIEAERVGHHFNLQHLEVDGNVITFPKHYKAH
ncbi:MAG: hypothetical protein JWO78_822 [Micavibrio sp.]|nr:hypothetical protein [Micavibrio sp.]